MSEVDRLLFQFIFLNEHMLTQLHCRRRLDHNDLIKVDFKHNKWNCFKPLD